MEGPAFSTKAESNVYRSWGMDVIGMTNLAEAKLAREAGICYATMAFVTDYDCWHDAHDSVTVEMVVGHIRANAELGRNAAVAICENAEKRLRRSCACADALKNAVITAPEKLTGEIKRRLAPILEGVL
jgi:5'-methylthioadenosine phosphorylase